MACQGHNGLGVKNIPDFAAQKRVLAAEGDFEALLMQCGHTQSVRQVLPSKFKVARQRVINEWSSRPRLVDRYACVSELMFEIEDYRGALAVSRDALPHAKGTELAGWFRIQMADALKILGHFDEAEVIVRQAIRLNTKLGDPYDIAGAYNNLGVLLIEKAVPEPRRALKPLERALATLDGVDMRRGTRRRREGLMVLRGRVLNNLGLAYEGNGDLHKALEYYHRAVAVKSRIGDVLGEAKTLGNIGIVMLMTGHPEAAHWRARALSIMSKYDLRRDMAYVLWRTGDLLCARGQEGEGEVLLQRALTLYRSVDGSLFGANLVLKSLKQLGIAS